LRVIPIIGNLPRNASLMPGSLNLVREMEAAGGSESPTKGL